MYKLLIIDDEPLILVGLESMLPWADYDITVCGKASNGRQALEMIESLQPDIVITDIKMPIMNGLELIEECHKRFDPTPEFIILTCHEDFPYVKMALKYRVVDYLIKLGLDADELSDAVHKAIELCDQKQPQDILPASGNQQLVLEQFKNRFIMKLLHNLFESEEQFLLQAKHLNLTFDAKAYAVATCQIAHHPNFEDMDSYVAFHHNILSMLSNLLSTPLHFHMIALDMLHFCFVFEFYEDSPYLDSDKLFRLLKNTFQTIENYFNAVIYCGVGDYKNNVHLISESHQEARQICFSCSDDEPLLFYQYRDIHTSASSLNNIFQITILKEDLHKAFNEADSQAFQRLIASVNELFCTYPNKYAQAMDLTTKILHLCLTNMPDCESYLQEAFADYRDSYCSLYNKNTTQQILKWLESFEQALTSYYKHQYRDFKNELIQDIIQYVSEHLSEKLILNEVAAIFSINPNYLGHLFKKVTSTGFNEYVTGAKIAKAKSLLVHSDMKLTDIADYLGYENYFYFSRVFKKVEGCSPSQYMQQMASSEDDETSL